LEEDELRLQHQLAFRPRLLTFVSVQLLALAGCIGLVIGAYLAPQRTAANVLLASNYLMGLALGALVLLALFNVTGARWGEPLLRMLEALGMTLPLGGLGLVAVLCLWPALYTWHGSAAAAGEAGSPLRSFWLDPPFFFVRALLYLGIWLAFLAAIVLTSQRQDRTRSASLARRSARLSAGFLVAFGVTGWLASSDWIMSLEPDWSSTIFGVYNFSGQFLSALAAATLLAIWLRQVSPLRTYLTEDHLHDLGKLLFGFSSFWMYTWFCQYLLIWYTNHPEETRYFLRRWDGAWPAFLLLDLVLNWAIPFVVLLFRGAKKSPIILGTVCLVVLAGRWVDLYVMIFPSQGAALAEPGLIESVVALAAVGLFSVVFFLVLSFAPLIPATVPSPLPQKHSLAAKKVADPVA
jgi:hypothetical protein